MFVQVGGLVINLGLVRHILLEDKDGDVGLWYGEYGGHPDEPEPAYEWVKGAQAQMLRAYLNNNSIDLAVSSSLRAKPQVDTRIPMTYNDMLEVIQTIHMAQNRYDVPGLERAKYILETALEIKVKGLTK